MCFSATMPAPLRSLKSMPASTRAASWAMGMQAIEEDRSGEGELDE
jgi:hypothetical protein